MADNTIVKMSGDWALYQGAVAAGALLYVYDAGTTNLASIYTDKELTVASANPVTADSGGLLPFAYRGTAAYKVVLKTSAGVTIKTEDNIPGALDTSTFTAATYAKPDTDCAAKTTDYTVVSGDLGTVLNCNPTSASFTVTLISAVTATNGRWVTVRHTGTANQVNIATVSSQTIDGVTSKALLGQYESVTLVSDGANWHIANDANRTVAGGTLQPQGYLTLTSATPLITSDVSAATAVYYTPFVGNLVPIYNGTRFVMVPFSELTLTLVASHAASQIYDVFVWLESNVVTIGTGPAWSTVTAGSGARGTGAGTTELVRTQGLHLNTVSMTTRNASTTYTVAASRGTYLGSIFMDGTNGQISCLTAFGQNRKWGVWNAFNRQPVTLLVGDSTASWTYNSTTIRQSNAAAGNRGTVFLGLAETTVEARFAQNVLLGSNQAQGARSGVGWNSTTAISGFSGRTGNGDASSGADATATSYYTTRAAIGIHNVNSLEYMGAAVSATFYGGEDDMQMTLRWLA